MPLIDPTTAVEPVNPSATPPPAAPEPPPAQQSTPEESQQPPVDPALLQIPAIAGLFAGTPAAFSAQLKTLKKSPELDLIVKNKSGLMNAGIGFYRSLSGNVGVMFNRMVVHDEAIKQADKAGKLLEIAPPFDLVNQQAGASPPPGAPAGGDVGAAPPPVNPPQSAQAPMPAAAQKNIIAKRVSNLLPQPATAGPNAGQGSLLKSILRPVL